MCIVTDIGRHKEPSAVSDKVIFDQYSEAEVKRIMYFFTSFRVELKPLYKMKII